MYQKELVKKLNIKTYTRVFDKEVKGFYVSDLLSWVLGKVKDKDYCLFTVVVNSNLIAVASLLEINTIIFPEGIIPEETIIKLAEEKQILLGTIDMTSAEALRIIYQK